MRKKLMASARRRIPGNARLLVASFVLFLATGPAVASALQVGDIIVLDGSNLWSIDPLTGTQETLASVPGATNLETAGGRIYAVTTTSVLQFDPSSGATRMLSSGGLLQSLVAIAVAGNGQIFVGNSGNYLAGVSESVVEINGVTGAETLVATGFTGHHGMTDMVIDLDGTLLVSTLLGDLYRVDPTTGTVRGEGDIDHTQAMDLDSNGELAQVHNGDSIRLRHPPFLTNGFAISPSPDFYVSDVAFGLNHELFFTGGVGLAKVPGVIAPGYFTPEVISPLQNPLSPKHLDVFVWTPPSLLLVGFGFLGLLGFAWRRNRQ